MMPAMTSRTAFVILIVVLASATFLRVHELDRHGLWIDEANSVLIADRDIPGVIEGLQNDANPPVYYLLLHYWIEIVGDSEQAVRALSILFSVALVFMLYVIGASLRGPPAGLFAAAACALHPLGIYHAQTARMYTLLPLLSLLSFWLLHRAITRGGRANWIAYILMTALAPLTHNWGLFLFPAGWAMFLLRAERAKLPVFLAAQAAAALPYLLWLPVIWKQAEFARTNWIARVMVEVPSILKVPMSIDSFLVGGGIPPYFAYFAIGTSTAQVWVARLFFGALLFLALRTTVSVLSHRREDLDTRDALLLSYFMVPLVVGWIASLFIPLYVAGRYDVIAFPAFALLAGHGFALIRSRMLQGIAVALLIGLAASAGRPYYDAKPRRDDLDTAHYLAKNTGPNDLIVFAGPRRSTVEYSLRRIGGEFSLVSFPQELADHMGLFEPAALLANPARLERDAREIAEMARQPGREEATLWIVDYPAGPLNVYLYRALGSFDPVHDKTHEGMRVFCFRPPADG